MVKTFPVVKTFPCYTAESLHNPKKLHNNIPDLLLDERDDRLSVLAVKGADATRRVGMVVRGLRCYRCYRGCSDTGGKWHWLITQRRQGRRRTACP
jgi:hypothetical protein